MKSETSAASRSAGPADKYLTFVLAGDEYGLPVLKVREIVTMMLITEVPQMSAHVKGVLNLRGRVIPVVDLRLKFGLPQDEVTERTCIVVVEVSLESGPTMIGIIVDRVSEVVNVSAEEIARAPEAGGRFGAGHIKGLITAKGMIRILLDLGRLLGTDDAALRVA